jgi:mRNA-degrading endonuclease HigB of HigAB toxin-antitoxin module
MVSISSGALTAVVGFIGVLVGTLIGPYINHKLSLKSIRKDIIFKRKLEYFEKMAENIEKNIRTYRNALREAESCKKQQLKNVNEKLKEERKNFLIMASPLYFNINGLSQKIISFVEVEKEIFREFEKLSNVSSKEQKEALKSIEDKLKKLTMLGNEAVYQMKKELGK